jgi:hypothetical protein
MNFHVLGGQRNSANNKLSDNNAKVPFFMRVPELVTSAMNTTGNVGITEHRGAFLQPLLLRKSNEYYML